MQAIWHLADVGDRTCDFLMKEATMPEQLEKTHEVQEVYLSIKSLVEDTITKDKAKKGKV